MGLIGSLLATLFGDGRNVIRDTAEVFRENAEAGAQRGAGLQTATLAQFAAEFGQARSGWFDRAIDGLNRIPRPALAFGTVGLFVAAMVDPVWFASRMQGIALVPEPLWWLLGAIVSFYFGARQQAKGQEFQRSIAETVARTQVVQSNIAALRALEQGAGEAEAQTGPNPALDDWRRG
ncbi:holin family protein [Anianabacter salinae]|uniref:holin family protein n=1 Tax=Anianabacter salinae TaxID=2851023 RepID=UPI00225DCEF0|nr:holin family protein [Anianabacter salinae]MBV0911549.1 holin family protein [Anianabacter salinae]